MVNIDKKTAKFLLAALPTNVRTMDDVRILSYALEYIGGELSKPFHEVYAAHENALKSARIQLKELDLEIRKTLDA